MNELYLTPLIGYKELIYSNGKLYSPKKKCVWIGAEQVATCVLEQGQGAPHAEHQCGLWAHNDITPEIRRRVFESDRGRFLLTLVWGYGKWYVNEISWRAQKMRIAALCIGSCDDVSYLGEVLDVPTMTLEEMREYASYAGMSLPRLWMRRSQT